MTEIDELNMLVSDYTDVDAELAVYRKKVNREFSILWMLSFDDRHYKESAKKIRDAYKRLNRLAIAMFYRIARHYKIDITKDWVLDYLEEFDNTTRYVFNNEVERKVERTIESATSALTQRELIKYMTDSMRFWNDMVTQYAVEIADEAIKMVIKSTGAKKVIWKTHEDERRCAVCGERHNKIYSIDKYPKKPHWRCRCWLEVVI